MSAMTRSIRLPIALATTTTCGDGSGKFCPTLRVSAFGSRFSCLGFRDGAAHPSGEASELQTSSGKPSGWLLRWPECIAAEDLAPS